MTQVLAHRPLWQGTGHSVSSTGSGLGSASFSGDNRRYTIGDMAREFGISLRTLRFYEDKGLLRPRREGSSRVYDGRDRVRLQVILKGKQLGFTLTEVRDLIGTHSELVEPSLDRALKPEQVTSQLEHLERQRADLEVAISELRATQARLAQREPVAQAG